MLIELLMRRWFLYHYSINDIVLSDMEKQVVLSKIVLWYKPLVWTTGRRKDTTSSNGFNKYDSFPEKSQCKLFVVGKTKSFFRIGHNKKNHFLYSKHRRTRRAVASTMDNVKIRWWRESIAVCFVFCISSDDKPKNVSRTASFRVFTATCHGWPSLFEVTSIVFS